ncbi:uncharacterized protein si:ch73-347e22.8 [Labrus bergylta]|uniref:uncharacterized protein si:ch73-347e22.8 n=1 Tax=Labrus bergylta TaxID=56723 RepID=UPI0033130AB0
MRYQWICVILSSLVSMGILVIVFGQQQVMKIMDKGQEKLEMYKQRVDNQYINVELIKMTMEKRLTQRSKELWDLEAVVAKLGPELEKKKTEIATCEKEKNKRTDDLTGIKKEQNEISASLNAASNAWNQEINMLKEQLTGYRSICDHVKNRPLALKLCGPKPSGKTTSMIQNKTP